MPRKAPGSWSYVPYTPRPDGGELRAVSTVTGEAVALPARRRKKLAVKPEPPRAKVPNRPPTAGVLRRQRRIFERLQRREMARLAAEAAAS